MESSPLEEEINQAYRPTYAIKVSFQEARMEKLGGIPLSSTNLVQVFEVEDMLFKSKKKKDKESYVVLTRGCRGFKNLTSTLEEV